MGHTNGLATTWTTGQSSMFLLPSAKNQLLKWLLTFFSYLGTSKILHSDNGREFVNANVASLCKEWPGEVTIVNGRPRNPKCQGNRTVEKMLGVCLLESDTDTPPWSEWLPIIQCKLLNCLHICFFDLLIY